METFLNGKKYFTEKNQSEMLAALNLTDNSGGMTTAHLRIVQDS